MPTRKTNPRRWLARGIAAGMATASLAAVISGLGTGAASAADARVARSPFLAELVRAQEACLGPATVPVAADTVVRCVGDLAQPDPRSVEEVDLWHLFRDCLWLAEQRALDDLDPPTAETYEDYVNDCLGL